MSLWKSQLDELNSSSEFAPNWSSTASVIYINVCFTILSVCEC